MKIRRLASQTPQAIESAQELKNRKLPRIFSYRIAFQAGYEYAVKCLSGGGSPIEIEIKPEENNENP